MTVKKFTVITVASIAMLTAAIVSAKYLKNDTEMNLPVANNGESMELKPLPYIDEKTKVLMIPLRTVVEQMGGSVEWNQNYDSIVISYKNTVMEILLDGTQGTINGNEIVFSEAWVNKDNHIYVTADFVSVYLNTEIDFEGDTNEIIVKNINSGIPIVSYNALKNKGKINSYFVQVPVITGLVDRNYEKQLNLDFNTEMRKRVNDYSTDSLDIYRKDSKNPNRSVNWNYNCMTGYRSEEFISIVTFSEKMSLDGKVDIDKSAININLQAQKFAALGDLFKNDSYLDIFREKYDDFQFNQDDNNNFYINGDVLVLFHVDENGNVVEYSQELFMFKNCLKTEFHYLIKK